MSVRYLVQDIETIPESEVASEWKPSEDEVKKSDGNPFPPIWAHRVITIGLLVLDENMIVKNDGCAHGGAAGGATEEEMVQRWADVASGLRSKTSAMRTVDFNGRRFDLPVLELRALRFGIPLDFLFGKLPDNRGGKSAFSRDYLDRYKGHHFDLADLISHYGAFKGPPLRILARLIGLPGKVGMDGGKTYDAWKEGKFGEIDTYCMQDVYQTAFLFMRWRYQTGEICLSTYRDAAKALLDRIASRPEHAALLGMIDEPRLLLSHLVAPPALKAVDTVDAVDLPPIATATGAGG